MSDHAMCTKDELRRLYDDFVYLRRSRAVHSNLDLLVFDVFSDFIEGFLADDMLHSACVLARGIRVDTKCGEPCCQHCVAAVYFCCDLIPFVVQFNVTIGADCYIAALLKQCHGAADAWL